MTYWRKGWDSNPRYPCRHAGFQDRCLKPLGHPSVAATSITWRREDQERRSLKPNRWDHADTDQSHLVAAPGHDFRHGRSEALCQQVGVFVRDMSWNRKQISWPTRNQRKRHFHLGVLDPKMLDRLARLFAAVPRTVDAGDGLKNDHQGFLIFLCEVSKRVQHFLCVSFPSEAMNVEGF